MATEQRMQHPFHMYEAILGQPEALTHAVRRNETAVDQFAAGLAPCERLFIVGIGTSHHAAQIGEHLMRVYGGGLSTRAVHSFDFALYGPSLTPRDGVIGISHRGTKLHTVEALKRAHEAGCCIALITGEGEAARAEYADVTFHTVAQEKSSAHTISYVGAIAVLACLAERIGYYRTGNSLLSKHFLHNELPAALRAALATESDIASLAREHFGRRRFWLVGGGPSAINAHEIALKIKETSYLQAAGMPIETMLHGPFQCTEAEDLFILIAPEGAAQRRVVELAGLVKEIGATYLVVSDGTPQSLRSDAAGWCVVPAVPEPFSALTCLIPLQLFAYHLALERGTNPDRFRLDDPRFARAYALVRL